MKCKICGKDFTSKHWFTKYCSPACSSEANYKRAMERNERFRSGKKTTKKYLTCRNGLEVKNDLLGFLMKSGSIAGY